jgi:DNA-binding CsgD family transcriptional regulator
VRRPRRKGGGGRPLTPREREVLGLVAEGATTGEIAKKMGTSFTTVRRIIRKLDGER